MARKPLSNGLNGHRDARGQFTRGNPGGPGNPLHQRMAHFRVALLSTIKPSDVQAVAEKLLERAKAGEPWAVKEFLDRCLGKAPQALELTGAEGEPLGLTLPALQSVVLDALIAYPEAKLAVAAALKEVAAGAGARTGDGA